VRADARANAHQQARGVEGVVIPVTGTVQLTLGAGDQDAEHDIYADDVIVEYPQSGEIIRGKHNIQAIRTHHPARRTFNVRKITGAGDTWVTEYLLTYDGAPTYTVSIMQFSGDHVTRETQYRRPVRPASVAVSLDRAAPASSRSSGMSRLPVHQP
jgi:hypothetical protein